jgi:hypothetical protein
MDKETARYIINHFGTWMNIEEKQAWKHAIYSSKSRNNPRMQDLMIERGLMSQRKEVIELLKDGYEAFELQVAERMVRDHPEKVVLNYCPICDKLARTPHAKQCRHCGHSWRGSLNDSNTAK